MSKKQLEEELNIEYSNIGSIEILDMHSSTINIKDINYISNILENIDPLEYNKPIVVAGNRWSSKYTLIDGYHRLKNKLNNGENTVECIVLDDYKINREKADNLFDFINSLVGKEIQFLDDLTLLVDGKYYYIEPNEGCGGCSSGNADIRIEDSLKGKKVLVKKVHKVDIDDEYDEDEAYSLYINDTYFAYVNPSYGNGYYGGDFEVRVCP